MLIFDHVACYGDCSVLAPAPSFVCHLMIDISTAEGGEQTLRSLGECSSGGCSLPSRRSTVIVVKGTYLVNPPVFPLRLYCNLPWSPPVLQTNQDTHVISRSQRRSYGGLEGVRSGPSTPSHVVVSSASSMCRCHTPSCFERATRFPIVVLRAVRHPVG